MFTSTHPADCAITLDDRTLERVLTAPIIDTDFSSFRVYAAGELAYRTGILIPCFFPPKLINTLDVPNLAQDKNFDFTWIKDVQKAYRCWMRARWKLYDPQWTIRGPPEWKDDYVNSMGSDAQLLCCRQRFNLGFIGHHTKGKATCVACGGTIKWRCRERRNYVSFRCIDQPCLRWTEEFKG